MAHSLLLLCVAWRTIEDKLELQRMAIRSVNIALNLDEVHGNRELPANFQAWLAVPDTNLPNKGTGHRPAWTDGKSEKTDEAVSTCSFGCITDTLKSGGAFRNSMMRHDC